MRLICSTIFLLLNLTQVNAFEVPITCLSKIENNKACDVCNDTSKLNGEVSKIVNLSNKLITPEVQFNLFKEKAKELQSANFVLKEKMAAMFRTLRDGDLEPTHLRGQKEIDKVAEDFKRLTILSKEANHLQEKFKVCLNNCSAIWKLEILDAIKKVQRLKLALLIGQPILSNKHFEKMFIDMPAKMVDSDEMYPKLEFEKTLNSALFDNLQTVLKKDYAYSRVLELNLSPSEVISQFPLITEDVVKEFVAREVNEKDKNPIACTYVLEFQKYTKKKEYQEVALDVGLFALPFAFGPVGRLGEMSAEFIFAEKLAAWGLRSEEVLGGVKIADIAFQAAFVSNEVRSIVEKFQRCQDLEAAFLTKATDSKLEDLDQCKSELSDKIILSEISSIGLATTTIAPKTINFIRTMTTAKTPGPKTAGLLFQDFGGGKNKMIRAEIKNMMELTKKEKIVGLSNNSVEKKSAIQNFIRQNKLNNESKVTVQIPIEKLPQYQKEIASDTVELLYIPGSEIPFLPNAINKVGHIALRIGNKVYHQTGGSGFKIESFEDFLSKTKKDYKVFGQVMEVSPKEKAVMESYFQKMHEKQLPYSFLVNNCAQAVCKSMKLADFENVSPILAHDPVTTSLQLERSKRVVMKTMYNADKDLSVEELKKATANNRLAFYGIPAVAAGAASVSTYEAVDFVIEYLNQIKESDSKAR